MKQITGTPDKLKNYQARLKSAETSLAMCQRWRQEDWAEDFRREIIRLTRLIEEAEEPR